MKAFLVIVGIIVLALIVFLFATGKINLKPARESVDKAVDESLKPITGPIQAKQKAEQKIKQIEKEWQEKHEKLLEDMEKYK